MKKDRKILARAPVDEIIHLEGNHYFIPESDQNDFMEISDRTYNCPKKGVCNWIDMKSGNSYFNDIAWVYPATKPEFTNITGRYGFYENHKLYEYSESE
ncbi:MAG: DUF427 domain-containing protein [Acidiferrobacterales bacterium]